MSKVWIQIRTDSLSGSKLFAKVISKEKSRQLTAVFYNNDIVKLLVIWTTLQDPVIRIAMMSVMLNTKIDYILV